MDNYRKQTGFTLVELVIVIVIAGILSVISVPIYRGYVEKAIMAEGQMLLSSIGKAELAYHLQHKRFLPVDKTDHSTELNVDSRGGKFFNKFYATLSGSVVTGMPETIAAEKNTLLSNSSVEKVNYNYDPRYAVYIEVYGKYKNRDLMLSATQYASGTLRIGSPEEYYYCGCAE